MRLRLKSHIEGGNVSDNDLETMYDCYMESMTTAVKIDARLYNGGGSMRQPLTCASRARLFSDEIPSASMASARSVSAFVTADSNHHSRRRRPPHSPEHIIFFTLA